MGKQKDTSLDRRDFIKHAVAGTTALTASSSLAADQAAVAPQSDARPPDNSPRDAEVLTQGSSGSDYMVTVAFQRKRRTSWSIQWSGLPGTDRLVRLVARGGGHGPE